MSDLLSSWDDHGRYYSDESETIKELRHTKEQLRSTVRRLRASNRDLRELNRELLCRNSHLEIQVRAMMQKWGRRQVAPDAGPEIKVEKE